MLTIRRLTMPLGAPVAAVAAAFMPAPVRRSRMMTAFLLLTLVMPVRAEAQLSAVTVRVDVAATKADGAAWDAFGGLPDIVLCVTRPGIAQRCEPVQCNDTLTCVFENVSWEPGSTVTVVDADAFSANDAVGSGVCVAGAACAIGQATVMVSGAIDTPLSAEGAAVTWAAVRDAYGGSSLERVWNAPGVRLVLGARPDETSTEVYVRAVDGGAAEWRIAFVPVATDDVSVDVAALSDGRLLVRVFEREPTCGSLCDEPGALDGMARIPVYRGYFLLSWSGSAPTPDEQWTTTSQADRPPRWVRRFEP